MLPTFVALLTTDADLRDQRPDLSHEPEFGGVPARPQDSLPGRTQGTGSTSADKLPLTSWSSASGRNGEEVGSRGSAGSRTRGRLAHRPLSGARLIDNAPVMIKAFETGDSPPLSNSWCAGPAAAADGQGHQDQRATRASSMPSPDRLKEKDALDAFRIFQAVDTVDSSCAASRAPRRRARGAVSDEATELFRDHASTPQGRVARLAAGGGRLIRQWRSVRRTCDRLLEQL